jgi:peptidoglycan/LPS O-acetylase OafA/YrhL
MIAIFVLFSLFPTIAHKDLFLINAGYSVLWLMCLYLIGAYIKYYGVSAPKKQYCLLGYGLCVFGAWFSKLVLQALSMKIFSVPSDGNRLIAYHSPFILFAAIFLLLYFTQFQVNGIHKKAVIKQIGTISFGVYLIHVNPFVWQSLIVNRYVHLCNLPSYLMIPTCLLSALIIFFFCTLIDGLRFYLFKFSKISTRTETLERNIKIP